ncbi:MAG: AtpZ/AtpI family protein [Syntrophomonadaceae bacterium]|jgi:F0F1-type ATP synthase assembly protein I
MTNTKRNKNWVRSLSDAINMATTIAAAVALGYFGGRWLDTRFDTEPWLTVAGFLLGVATGIKVMWDRAMAGGSTYTTRRDDDSSKDN